MAFSFSLFFIFILYYNFYKKSTGDFYPPFLPINRKGTMRGADYFIPKLFKRLNISLADVASPD